MLKEINDPILTYTRNERKMKKFPSFFNSWDRDRSHIHYDYTIAFYYTEAADSPVDSSWTKIERYKSCAMI